MYLCIDLKSFYASVECVVQGYDPFNTALVVADPTHGAGAITLAATPYIKSFGVKSRGRLYEIPKTISYICQKPRMELYLKYSCLVYDIYLKYFSSDDIFVYSVDEAFINVAPYLRLYNKCEVDIAKMVIDDIYDTLNLTATAGVGENMYLAKIALDIISKHSKSNIGYLTKDLYLHTLSKHRPLSDFWQIGPGIERHLHLLGIDDMEGIRRCDDEILYKEFGVNAKYLIMHSKGEEDSTIEDIKAYKPLNKSISESQILERNYSYNEAMVVLLEMIDNKCIELTEKGLSPKGISLMVSYDNKYMVGHSGGSKKMDLASNLFSSLKNEMLEIYKTTTIKNIPIRRIGIAFFDFKSANDINLFVDLEKEKKEINLYKTISKIKEEYGRSSIGKGMNLYKCATAIKRNKLLGGHNRE